MISEIQFEVSLMKLGKTEILRPQRTFGINFGTEDKTVIWNLVNKDRFEYLPFAEQEITRIDVLYGHLHGKPEWTFVDYAGRIMKPMVDKLSQQIADSIMHGSARILSSNPLLAGLGATTSGD